MHTDDKSYVGGISSIILVIGGGGGETRLATPPVQSLRRRFDEVNVDSGKSLSALSQPLKKTSQVFAFL